jgi:hypothetical protein
MLLHHDVYFLHFGVPILIFRQVQLPLLQSHFAHVERSKLDQRYADYEQGERMQLDDVPEDLEAAEEKDCPNGHSVFARLMAPVNASKKSPIIE